MVLDHPAHDAQAQADALARPARCGQAAVARQRIAGHAGPGVGDLDRFVAQFIDDCPEGWIALDKAERCADPIGVFGGKFDGIIATCDAAVNSLCFEAQYLYLVHQPKRRLYVFKIENRDLRPFGMVTFDATGKAKPNKLPAVEHEE